MVKRRLGNTGVTINQRERPRRAVCPSCGKRGLKLPTFSSIGMRGRECQYCLHWHPLQHLSPSERRVVAILEELRDLDIRERTLQTELFMLRESAK